MQREAKRSFEIGEAVGTGWRLFWPNILPMALFALIVWAVDLLIQLLQDDLNAFGRFLFNLLGFVIGQLIAIGWIKLALDIHDGKRPNMPAVLGQFRVFVPYMIAAVLYGLMIGIGLILLVIPGIIVAIVFAFYGFHIVDTDEKNPIDAFRRSAEITKGNRWKLFLFGLVLLGINIIGVLILVVGVLFTSGISLLAIAYVYRRLSGTAPVEEPAVQQTPDVPEPPQPPRPPQP